MRARYRYVLLVVVAGLSVSPTFATLNFPAIATLGGSYLSQAQTFDTNYTQYAQSFSHYYGDTAAFASYLSSPIGKDNLGKFPALYVGIGLGATAGKVNSMKNEVNSSIQSNVPPYLIADAISFNFGIGFSRQWDVRFSFFPNAGFTLPSSALGSSISAELKSGLYKARVGYNLVESSFLRPGVTVAGFAFYSTSLVSVTQTGLTSTSTDSTGTTSISATSKASLSGQYVGIGPEIKVWYDLKFFHPFVGYSLGLQMGQFTTALTVEGSITVTPTGLSAVTDTGSIVISERYAAKLLSHRLMFGFEISLFVLDIGVEAQVDMVNGLVGAAVGTGLRF